MTVTITQSTAFPMADITFRQGETVLIERGCMMWHSGVTLEGKMNSSGAGGLGGALKAIGRSMVSGESMFITHASGQYDGARIAIAPGAPGAIKKIQVGQQQWRISDSAFLACDASVNYKMVAQNLGKAIFGGTGGLFVMETQGQGDLLVSSFGDIVEMQLDGRFPFIADNMHVVAWSNTLNYNIRIASGTFGFTSGEGLVNEFNGVGTVLLQTRNLQSLAGALSRYIVRS